MMNSKNEWHGQGLPRIVIEGKEEKEDRIKREKAEKDDEGKKKRGRKNDTAKIKSKKMKIEEKDDLNVTNVMFTEGQNRGAESSDESNVLVMKQNTKTKKKYY